MTRLERRVADIPVRRNTLLLAVAMAVYSSVLQLVAAVSSLTFVLVTGVEGLLGLGPGDLPRRLRAGGGARGAADGPHRAPAGHRGRVPVRGASAAR